MYDVNSAADPSTISSELLRGVLGADDTAWRRLVQIYGPLVYRWCRESQLQASDAADATQEVFFALMQGIHGFRYEGEEDTFRGWLRTITRNKVRDLVRRRARAPHALGETLGENVLSDSLLPQPDADLVQGETMELMQRTLAIIERDFDPTTWQAFCQMALHERSAADVAAELNMTSKAVRQAKYRVLLRLRDELEPFVDASPPEASA